MLIQKLNIKKLQIIFGVLISFLILLWGLFIIINHNLAPTAYHNDINNSIKPIAGKWDGVNWNVGLYNPATGEFKLRTTGLDIIFTFGSANANFQPISGDWTGSGKYSVGLYDNSTATFYLKNTNTTGYADKTFIFGSKKSSLIPIAGDWTGSGKSSIGIYNPENGQVDLRTSVSNNDFNTTEFVYKSTNPYSLPIAGIWLKDTKNSTIGIYNPIQSTFYLRYSNTTGYAEQQFAYGDANKGLIPVVGDWDNTGIESVGLYNSNTDQFYLKNTNTTGYAEQVFNYSFATTQSEADPTKLTLADFYWWYPWYGAQHFNPSQTQLLPPSQVNGYLVQTGFKYQMNPIPFLNSSERQIANPPNADQLAVDWFKGIFSRAANSGIDVITPMTRPDLALWKHALTLMIQAQKQLKNSGQNYSKLAFHLDGVEYWDKDKPSTGILSNSGQKYIALWTGVKDTFDTVFSSLSIQEIPTFFYLYPNNHTFPILVYRVEENAYNFSADDGWVNQLKIDFKNTYPNYSLYLILDDTWCKHSYGIGIINTTCNADNSYHWGGALEGAILPENAKVPIIITVGPGFDNSSLHPMGARIQSRNSGKWYASNFSSALNLGANWIIIETFNFGEEGTAIDKTTEFGTQYLDQTKILISNWKFSKT